MAVVTSAGPLRERQDTGIFIALGAGALALLGALMGAGLVLGEIDAFYVCLSVIACFAVLYDFRVGALLLILMLPLSESNIFPHSMLGMTGLNPVNLVMGATALSYLLHGRLKAGGAAFAPRQVLLLYVLPLVLGGLLGSRHVDEIAPVFFEQDMIRFDDAGGYLRDVLIKPLMMVLDALLIGAALAQSKKPERFLIPVGASIWIMCLLSLWFVARSGMSLAELADPLSREFFSGLGIHANSLGRMYAVAYALLLFSWAGSDNKHFRLLCVASMGLIVLSLVLTFSRGAFVGFLIVNALFMLWRFNARTTALALLVGVALFLLLPHQVFDRATFGFDEDANAVSAGRLDTIWGPILPEIWNSPIWGNGLNSVMWSEPMRNGLMLEVTHPHNAYLEAMLDVGLIGLGLLLAYFAHVWKGLRRLGSNAFLAPEMRGFYQGATAALVSFLVTGFAGSSFAPSSEYSFLWIAIGMMYGQLARRPAG
jgi:O-antigen ligase